MSIKVSDNIKGKPKDSSNTQRAGMGPQPRQAALGVRVALAETRMRAQALKQAQAQALKLAQQEGMLATLRLRATRFLQTLRTKLTSN